MGQTVECFYTLSSPWMYLGGPQLTDIIKRHGATLLLKPYDFRLVIKHTGGIPLRSRPEPRQDYHALELDRWSRYLNIPLKLKPKHYPPSEQRQAGRMIMAAQARGLDAMALSHAMLRALWLEDRDIADPRVRVAIAEEEGLPGEALHREEESQSVDAEWERNNQEAVQRGVFGAPTFFCGDLWLWGQDRLFFLDKHLAGEQVQSGASAKIAKIRGSMTPSDGLDAAGQEGLNRPRHQRHVAIIGAGIVGACSAVEALRHGFRVTIIDPAEPGGEQSASYGNGCWLSPMSVIPPAFPGLWKKVPKFLMDPLGPLAIRWSYFPRVAPWLVRYLRAGWTWDRVEDAARALRPLVVDAPALHQRLAEEAGVSHLIERRGLIYVYPSRTDFEAEAMAWEIRHKVGVRWMELDANELRQREPELDRRYTFGVMVEEGGHCTDPGAYTAALVAHAVGQGAEHRRAAATGFVIEGGRLKAVRTDRGDIAADAAVIAAGAHAKPLAAAAGDTVPLETERGYHAELADPEVSPRHGLMPSDGKMSVMRTRNGLRCAGQVEIAGLDAEPNWKRAEILRDHLLRCFPGLPRDLPADRVKVWMGHRPSMPDGKPCLGFARASPDIIHAFGHGHTGLVAGARTGRVVADLLAGREPEIPISPFDPRRFA